MDDESVEAEADEEVDAVLTEITKGTVSQMASVPVSAKQQTTTVSSAEKEKKEEADLLKELGI